jgi:hypothetical protein
MVNAGGFFSSILLLQHSIMFEPRIIPGSCGADVDT